MSYGDNMQAILTYLATYQLIPLKRSTELVEDIFGVKVSQGTIVAAEQEAYGNLADAEDRIKEEVLQSEIVNFDETGMSKAN